MTDTPKEGGMLSSPGEPKKDNVEAKTEKPKVTQPKRNDDDEVVTVTKGGLREMLGDIEKDVTEKVRSEFSKEMQEQKETIALLIDSADEKRLFNAKSRLVGPLTHTLRISTYNDKAIVGWRVVKDVVQKNPQNGTYIEQQSVEIILEDDSKVEFESYLRFDDVKRASQHEVKILGKEDIMDGSGQLIYRVEHPLKKGEELKIASPFVN